MTIDGVDISMYGLRLLEGSLNSVFRYPKRKAVGFSNYAEEDGIRPDLRKFETEVRRVTLHFHLRHRSGSEFFSRYEALLEVINGAGYRVVSFDGALTHRLRYDKAQKVEPFRLPGTDGATLLTLDFLEDVPAISSGVTEAAGAGVRRSGWYVVDDVDFADFGVYPYGELGSVLRYPDAKEAFSDGRTVYTDVRRLKHKELTVPLCMVAESQAVFRQNYQAFYNAFARLGKRLLYIREVDAFTTCYYTDCTSYEVFWGEARIMAKFNIGICIPVVTWLSG